MTARMFHPRYWLTWLGLGLLRLLVFLPWPVQRWIGRGVGAVLRAVAGKRRRIAHRNIERCFPELSRQQRHRLLRRHFRALGLFPFEAGMAWWASNRRIAGLSQLNGLEHLRQALDRGRGVLLVAGHFTHLEFGARVINESVPIHPMYRRHRNLVLEAAIKRAREHFVPYVIPREEIRRVIRTLRKNGVVWYAPDQDPGRQRGVFAPFFGIATATHTATRRLARRTGAAVVPMHQKRLADGHYVVTLRPPLEGFPGDDENQDAARLNAELEAGVRDAPDQYLWIHRRFKTRPQGEADFYADLDHTDRD